MTREPFDPLEILAVLERNRIAFVLVGRLAAVVHGAGGIADEVEICPQIKESNLQRLEKAIVELGGEAPDLAALSADARIADTLAAVKTRAGMLVIVPVPDGTRGWDDLRRRASREPLGGGVRAPVAAAEDLVRIAGSAVDPDRRADVHTLRRVAELDKGRGLSR